MSNEAAREDDTDRTSESTGDSLANGEIEVRLSPKSEYLPVLRAIVGVAAGILSFNYDEIVQLRVAVSEAFELAVGHPNVGEQAHGVGRVAVRLVLKSHELEISVTGPGALPGGVAGVGMESRALLESLLDEVDFDAGAGGQRVIRMVKRKSANEASGHG